ncbi:MAG TPA: FAD-binding oxidoreductase [Bryobacteraceae bacterium]|nr:FAD-binding oxidoreductase [Bryobacteraceae bacterium]
MDVTAWQNALQAWIEAIGSRHVETGAAALAAAEKATFATNQRIPVILRPGSRDEVAHCLRIANSFRCPVYPVSTGKNWGYGSRVPARTQTALLDLSRLNRIVEYNEELAFVTVEPGVTQRQLSAYLAERKSSLWMDATGSSPDASLIGNTLERGFGHTPYGEHFNHAAALEVVLPNGDCIATGFARFPNANTGPLFRWGVGPSLDGLFSQSGFGIVTRMSIQLMPAPEYFQAFFFRCDSYDQLGAVLEVLRPLRLNGTLPSSVHIANDYRILSGLRQFPWELTNGQTPLLPAALPALRRSLNIGAWNASGGLYGSKEQVAVARRLLRHALRGKVSRLTFLDDRALRLTIQYARPLQFFTSWDLSRAAEMLPPVYGLLKGIPTAHALRGAYWRKKSYPAVLDPDLDHCGLLWHAPILPATPEDAARLHDTASRILLEDGFEPMMTLSLVNGRAFAAVISICYDRDVPDEDARAMACYRRLVDSCRDLGYYSYRLGVQSSAEMDGPPAYADLLRRLKAAVDPNHILAPGRYQPPASASPPARG